MLTVKRRNEMKLLKHRVSRLLSLKIRQNTVNITLVDTRKIIAKSAKPSLA